MSGRNTLSVALHPLDSRTDRSKGRSPTQNQNLTCLFTHYFNEWDVVRGSINFFLPQLHHQVVILRIIVNVAGDVLFLDTADAMFEARRAGQSIWASECFLVTCIRHEGRRVRRKRNVDLW